MLLEKKVRQRELMKFLQQELEKMAEE